MAVSCVVRLLLFLAIAAPVHAEDFALSMQDRHRVDTAGVPGSLVLSGEDVPAAALDAFLRLGRNGRVVVLRGGHGGAGTKALVALLLERSEEFDFESIEIVRAAKDEARTADSLSKATAVWIAAESAKDAESVLTEAIREDLRIAAERGIVVGASGHAAARLGSFVADDDGGVNPGKIALLPDSCVRLVAEDEDAAATSLETVVDAGRGLVGYEPGNGSALVVRGRRVGLVGDGRVRIVLPTCDWREDRGFELNEEQRTADLTALRLSAIDRRLPRFPAAKPPAPRVPKGTLIVIGGGGMPKGIVERFVETAGGEKARIVVLPTAVPDPVPRRSSIAEAFREAGAGKVTVLPGRTRDVVDGEESLAALREATGIWFGGGRQWRFADAYLGTKALELMHDVLKRDGVVMGSSAGASIQGGYLARANPLGNRDIMAEGYERGLGFLPGVAIDQHFAQRRRFADMTALVDRYPQLLGLGIDEATALVVRGQLGTVVGRSRVHVYDRNQPVPEEGPDHVSLPAGSVYDLVERKVVTQPAPAESDSTPPK